MQESGGPQSDGGTEQSTPADEQSIQTGDHPIGIAQLRSALTAAIQDQQLMPESYLRFYAFVSQGLGGGR
jgi:hypothetical protein